MERYEEDITVIDNLSSGNLKNFDSHLAKKNFEIC